MKSEATPTLFARLKATKRLPSPPGTALRVIELCQRDDTEITEISDVIKSDPVLTGRLLKFANSALMGLNCEVTSVRQAVLLLGLRTVMLTALGFSLAMPEPGPRCEGFHLKRFWSRSFAIAVIARRITARLQKELESEEAFTVGLLAHIGQLAMAQCMQAEYSRVMVGQETLQSLIEAEQRAFQIDHVAFGAQLLEDWQLPDRLVRAVRFQTEPHRAGDAAQPLAQAIALAESLAPLFTSDTDLTQERRAAAQRIIESDLKLNQESWQAFADQIMGEYRQIAEIFEVELSEAASVLDIYAEAQHEAARVGMVAQLEQARTLETNRDLMRRATTDGLTGVANRARFDEKIDEMVLHVHRGHDHFAVILFDIDHFKKFNDTHGHATGDLVLARVARIAQNTVREVDLLARYGGEEFAILAAHADRKGACALAARLRKAIADLRIEANGETLHVTISVGLALTVDHGADSTKAALLAEADKQLYLSKQAGRNTWSYLGRSASKLNASRATG